MKKGFTLIEILVSVIIIGILTTVGIASYNNFNERRVITEASENLKLYIRLAASKAINNEKDCSVSMCGSLDGCVGNVSEKALVGWYVDLGEKEIYGKCDNKKFGNIVMESLDDVTVEADVADVIQFYPLSKGTDLPSALTISINGNPVLIVDPSGNVY